MKTTIHNKLVRDRIPQIIRDCGNVAHTRIMEPEEYVRALIEKMAEETGEFAESHSVEEMADMLEVFLAIAHHFGFTLEQIQKVREEKRQRNGGFADRIFLTAVDRVE